MIRDENDFKKLISRLNIDDKPSSVHRENLHRQMLSTFDKADRRVFYADTLQTLGRTIMMTKMTKLTAAAVIIIAVITGIYYLTSSESSVFPKTPTDSLVALDIKLPKPMFVGTPPNLQVPNLEKPRPESQARPVFYVPVETKNVAFKKPISSTDEEPIIGEIAMITDGDKEAADGSYVELGPFLQHVTIDLEAECDIYAIVVWHYHKQARVYFDVVVQVADDADFLTKVRTVFNNDIDNSAGLGIGEDMHYVETAEGKLIDAKGIRGRYVRLYSKGNNSNELNHYIEVEVYGKPVE